MPSRKFLSTRNLQTYLQCGASFLFNSYIVECFSAVAIISKYCTDQSFYSPVSNDVVVNQLLTKPARDSTGSILAVGLSVCSSLRSIRIVKTCLAAYFLSYGSFSRLGNKTKIRLRRSKQYLKDRCRTSNIFFI